MPFYHQTFYEIPNELSHIDEEWVKPGHWQKCEQFLLPYPHSTQALPKDFPSTTQVQTSTLGLHGLGISLGTPWLLLALMPLKTKIRVKEKSRELTQIIR